MSSLELWGGPECTVVRVGDNYSDQFELSGHRDRIEDLDLFAGLGLSALRYPVLWERVSPNSPDQTDWSWLDARLARLRALNMRPIAGLVHHGSGPRYTNLLDEGFAPGLARHARNVAERYGWIEDWTPVNEPLTTARFSALYGHWYPHERDERSFWLALLNQIDAVRLSMGEIRKVNPAARLIQTEDLGRTFSTASLRRQAGFDNVRRWTSWDLLCGRVTRDHPFWNRLAGLGFADRLRAIADSPCPPDVIGVNHYLTSDRFLDHRLARYPHIARGRSWEGSYVDVEAVRVLNPPPPGLAGALREAWARYGIPLAVTEAHNGSTREEQMRWTAEAWQTALDLRDAGVDIRAVTSWALLGSNGWDKLLTGEGSYECGAFDVRGGAPRVTATAAMMRQLASGAPSHPVLDASGWWRRPIRFHHPLTQRPAPVREHHEAQDRVLGPPPPVLIAGGDGMVGGAVAAACRHRAIACVTIDGGELGRADEATIGGLLDEHRPWAIVDAGADWPDLDSPPVWTLPLARAAAARGTPVAHITSEGLLESVGGGEAREGWADLDGALGAIDGPRLLIRTSHLFTPYDPRSLVAQAVRALAERRRVTVDDGSPVQPTFLPFVVDAALDLLIDGSEGSWALAHEARLSRAELIRRLAGRLGLDERLVDDAAEGGSDPRGPTGAEHRLALRTLDEAIAQCAAELGRTMRITTGASA